VENAERDVRYSKSPSAIEGLVIVLLTVSALMIYLPAASLQIEAGNEVSANLLPESMNTGTGPVVRQEPTVIQEWHYSTDGGDAPGTPAIWDIDGDSGLEVVFSQDGIMRCVDVASGVEEWNASTTEDIEYTPAIGAVIGAAGAPTLTMLLARARRRSG